MGFLSMLPAGDGMNGDETLVVLCIASALTTNNITCGFGSAGINLF